MQVTVLIENTSENGLFCEHGLSLFIEYKGTRILLDAGSSERFYDNAKALGVPLGELDFCVLSHGHYDHSGGFGALFGEQSDGKVYAQKGALDISYYAGRSGLHEIGIPCNVRAFSDRFVLVDGYRQLAEGVYLVPHSTPNLAQIGERERLYRQVQNTVAADDFSHEQSLVFDTEHGLAVFNSCSHGGVQNIIREVKDACGGKPVWAYVGGLHMKGRRKGEEICTFSAEELDALCAAIRAEGIESIYTGHCTGLPGLREMQKRLGSTVHPLTTGMRFEI